MVQAQAIASTWLQGMGLALKPRHTRIAQTRHPIAGVAGCDCLGFQIRPYPVGTYKPGRSGQGKPLGCNTHLTPSPAAQRTHLPQITEAMRTRRAAPQAQLIRRLNPLLWGGSHSDSTVVAKATSSRRESLGVRATAARGTPSSSHTVRLVGAGARVAPPGGPRERQNGEREAPAAPCRHPHPSTYAGDGGTQPVRGRLDRLGHPHGQTPRHLSEMGIPPQAAPGPMPLVRTVLHTWSRPWSTRPHPPPLTRRRGEVSYSTTPPWTGPCRQDSPRANWLRYSCPEPHT